MNDLETMHLMNRVLQHVEDDEGCWVWTGATTATGHPIINLRNPPEGLALKGCTLVRRLSYLLNGGELTARQPIDSRCDNKLCVNPAHLVQSTASRIAKKAAKKGGWKGIARRMRISKAKRKNSKLTAGAAQEIKLSTESGPVLAARYGVNKSLINNIKRGVIWKAYGNPFTGLGGRGQR